MEENSPSASGSTRKPPLPPWSFFVAALPPLFLGILLLVLDAGLIGWGLLFIGGLLTALGVRQGIRASRGAASTSRSAPPPISEKSVGDYTDPAAVRTIAKGRTCKECSSPVLPHAMECPTCASPL